MLSIRCKMIVKEELKKLGLHFILLNLDEAEIMEIFTNGQREELKSALFKWGFELLDDKKAILLEKIKNVIVEKVHYADELPSVNFSDFISEKLHYDYTYLSNLFSEVQDTTIEHFIIAHKIERIKELIIYDKLNITEIAWKMNYDSVAHLSNQFKQTTGLSPTHFKHLKDKKRSSIENVRNLDEINN